MYQLLDFLEKEELELPSTATLWQSLDTINNIFYVEVKSPNGSIDQYAHNNLFKSPFAPTPIYPSFFGLCIQTNSGTSLPFISETTWDIYDSQGNTIYTSGPLSWGTQYRDTILLNPGCYRFEVMDTDDDGLDFWANNDGSGVVRFITTPISCNAPEVNILILILANLLFMSLEWLILHLLLKKKNIIGKYFLILQEILFLLRDILRGKQTFNCLII